MMIWTRKAPTSKGWYWYRAEPTTYPIIVEVERDGNGGDLYIVRLDCDENDCVAAMHGEWSSTPIVEPGEVE